MIITLQASKLGRVSPSFLLFQDSFSYSESRTIPWKLQNQLVNLYTVVAGILIVIMLYLVINLGRIHILKLLSCLPVNMLLLSCRSYSDVDICLFLVLVLYIFSCFSQRFVRFVYHPKEPDLI